MFPTKSRFEINGNFVNFQRPGAGISTQGWELRDLVWGHEMVRIVEGVRFPKLEEKLE